MSARDEWHKRCDGHPDSGTRMLNDIGRRNSYENKRPDRLKYYA